jgi:UDP-galactopyranose mutase
MPELSRLLARFLASEPLESGYAVWFYTPMALPLIEQLHPAAVVYDCMDELSAFLNAPPALLESEARLFSLADIVFTGGPSLYKAKKDRHANVHCFPSSVDADHFSRGVVEKAQPEDQSQLPTPRFGYYGVIDERIDLQLLDSLAKAHPEWQIVMVGPVVKIDEKTLPRHPNLHYTGQRSYADLPAYLKGWDVCLLPFARNESTRFISPTKTLEYMAAGKLMVSTPITDVAEPYGHIAYLGDTPEAFIRGCEQALAAPPVERRTRLEASARVLSQTSWDRTAAAMNALIEQAIASRLSTPVAVQASEPESAQVLVIGAGPTGLSAAYHLGGKAQLIEQNGTVGGWCRSVEDGGFTFDYAGHIMFSADPYVHQMYQMLLGDNVHWQDREAWIYSKNVYTRYPFQGSLYGLPSDVIKECVVGAIESRFGTLKKERPAGGNGTAKTNGSTHTNGHANGQSKLVCDPKDPLSDCCGDGVMEAAVKLGQALSQGGQASEEPRNFEEFIYKVWGRGIAKHFAIPYNRKLWAVPLTEMETSWLGGRVPMPDLEEMIDGALKPSPKPMGPNARFGYPLRGGFQALMNGFLPHLKNPVRLNSRVAAVAPDEHTVTLTDGTRFHYSQLISTMPLPVLIGAMGAAAPPEIRRAVRSLRHVSVRCVNIGVGRESLTDKHWIYYPEDTVFHRIFVQGNASPYCNPPGGFGLTCEITYSEHKPLPCDGEALIQRCIEDCHRVGFFNPEDPVLVANQVDMPYAYVVYDHARKQAVETIREWLATKDILLAGRYSEWEYYNSDHAFIAGKKAAEEVLAREERAAAEKLMPQQFRLPAGVIQQG